MTDKISPELASVIATFAAGNEPSIAQLALLNDLEIARVAMLQNLYISFMPISMDTRLRATGQLLQYTKARPATSVHATVKSAEAWLESIDTHQIEDGSDDE